MEDETAHKYATSSHTAPTTSYAEDTTSHKEDEIVNIDVTKSHIAPAITEIVVVIANTDATIAHI